MTTASKNPTLTDFAGLIRSAADFGPEASRLMEDCYAVLGWLATATELGVDPARLVSAEAWQPSRVRRGRQRGRVPPRRPPDNPVMAR